MEKFLPELGFEPVSLFRTSTAEIRSAETEISPCNQALNPSALNLRSNLGFRSELLESVHLEFHNECYLCAKIVTLYLRLEFCGFYRP